MNYGFIPRKLESKDYVFGEAKVTPSITLEIPNWETWLPKGELQYGLYFDSAACVTFSALNVLETLFRYLIAYNKVSQENLKWLRENGYINERGDVEFSDRFTAKMSGTTAEGNTGWAVANSIRTHGLVPESKWTFSPAQRTPVFQFDEYYAEIPEELKAIGLEFKARFDINYEAVLMDEEKKRLESLLHSPLQVFVHAWNAPVDGVYTRTTEAINHAVVNFKGKWPIFDTYLKTPTAIDAAVLVTDIQQFIKNLAPDFLFYPYGYTYTITEKKTMRPLIKGDKSERVFVLGVDGKRRHVVFPGTLEEGKEAGFWGGPIVVQPQAEVEAIPEGHPIGFIL